MTVEKEYSKLRNKALISSQNYILKPTDSNKQEMIKANENFERLCADILEKLLEENRDILKRLKFS